MAKSKPAKTTDTAAWEKRHAAGEKLLTKALKSFFDDQRKRIVTALKKEKTITADSVSRVFDAAEENTKLLAAVKEPIQKIMAVGAGAVLAEAEKHQPKGKAKTKKESSVSGFTLPDWFFEWLSEAWTELESQPYWEEIQMATSEHLTALISKGVEDGIAGPEMTKRVNEALGGLSKVRAANIARTESSLANNQAHAKSISQLAADGVVSKKRWLAILDADVRASHAALDGTEVDPDADFDVGGHKTQYPAAPSLPPQERCRCRCTIVAVFAPVE